MLQKSENARASGGPLLGRLIAIAAEGNSKLAQRAEGIRAALAVALAAETDSKAESSVPASFWALLTGPKAALLSTATLAKLAPEDAALQLHLAESLLLQASRAPSKLGVVRLSVCTSRQLHILC